jgi:hypothetical protein
MCVQSFPGKLDTTTKLDTSLVTFSGTLSLKILGCNIIPLHTSTVAGILMESITRIGGYEVDNKRDM